MSNKEICGYTSLLYSIADKPLHLWSKYVSLGGKIRRIRDDTLNGDKVIEVTGPHDSTMPTNIAIPKTLNALNVKLPVLVLIIKNLNLRFKLDVQVRVGLFMRNLHTWRSLLNILKPLSPIYSLCMKITDKEEYRRRFSFMTYNIEKLPNISANVARVPLKLEECWNILEIDLQTLCRKAYGTDYRALQKLIIYPNCYLRRVYLQDRHYKHDEMPVDVYQAFFNIYISKRGINSIDRACQTEECHRGCLHSLRNYMMYMLT